MSEKTNARPGALREIGVVAVLAGLLGLAAVGGAAAFGKHASGEVPACCLVLIMVGLGLAKPELLQDDTAQTSTMRVALIGLVTLFMLVTTKAAWTASDLAHLTLDRSWTWLLAAALGGKAVQSFSESWPASSSGSRTAPATVQPDSAGTAIHPTPGPMHRPKTL
ncbi:MAG TPA: hypothetical protein VLC06_02445 [Polyangia bacterium]|jgi:hypothetical protein|nr:hypothetical protein [Polyangia bacterium]